MKDNKNRNGVYVEQNGVFYGGNLHVDKMMVYELKPEDKQRKIKIIYTSTLIEQISAFL
jgi:hypothetical protein